MLDSALTQEAIRASLPTYLRQFVAEQNYHERYTRRDHAVWRYVLAQLVNHLKDKAHPVYFDGLRKAGISLDAIPSIDEMNVCLSLLGWKAIVVDGFIPPQAFMELQALKVLAIAVDMRSLEHIQYTPAPDIVHEAAGHAPIIADEEYSEYLQRFGEVGVKALYNKWDVSVYEAVRALSIAKENGDQTEVDHCEMRLKSLTDSPGKPSELALLTRLHWWTVEYGLVGSVEKSGIFGAGLLSSLSESKHCLSDEVLKRPLTVEAVLTSYDITREQPQLFVTKSCRHLTQVLEEYAATMCYQKGGQDAIQTAIDSEVVTTCEYSSGLQVSGKFVRLIQSALGEEVYIGSEGPTQLSSDGKQLSGHGTQYHAQGFGAPVGRICNLMKPLEDACEYDLQQMSIQRDERVNLEFLSGVIVDGKLNAIRKEKGKILLFSFSDCKVTGPDGECLFYPSWGDYDMAVGERIISVFAGSADKENYDVYPAKSEKVSAQAFQSSVPVMENEFFKVLDLLRDNSDLDAVLRIETLGELIKNAEAVCPDAWLLHLEIYEASCRVGEFSGSCAAYLEALGQRDKSLFELIKEGMRLVDQRV